MTVIMKKRLFVAVCVLAAAAAVTISASHKIQDSRDSSLLEANIEALSNIRA